MSGYQGVPRPLRIYNIAYNGNNMNWAAFHQYLTDNRDIEGYWNYIPFIYFIKTRVDVGDISARLRPFFPSQYLVAEIVGNPALQGGLPLEAWDWFRLDASPGGLSSYLPPPPLPR